MRTSSRILESIVPSEYKKTFSLYVEDEPQFSLSTSPKKVDGGDQSQNMSMTPPAPDAPVEPESVTTAEKPAKGDESSWLIKKLVGILRYGGAMSTQLKGGVPDEAAEIIDKIEKELEAIAASLEPFITNKEAKAPEGEENTEAPPVPDNSTEEPVVPTTKPAFAPKKTQGV